MKINECPICGHSAWVDTSPIPEYKPAVSLSICCSNPECPMNEIEITQTTLNMTKEKAIEELVTKWNLKYNTVKILIKNNNSNSFHLTPKMNMKEGKSE